MVNRYFIFLIYTICFYTCSNNTKEQSKIDIIASKTLMHIIQNRCFEYNSFSNDSIQNIVSVSKQFVLEISERDSASDLDVNIFLNKKQNFFLENDTFHISNWSDKKVIMSDWTNVAIGLDFQYELSKKISGKAEITSICSYVFSRPYIIELTNERQILFKIMRYYDNPIEYCYALVKTNKDFEINSIQCYRQKKQFIPLPTVSND